MPDWANPHVHRAGTLREERIFRIFVGQVVMLRDMLWLMLMSPGILGQKMWGAGTQWGGRTPWLGWESPRARFWISLAVWAVVYTLFFMSLPAVAPAVPA